MGTDTEDWKDEGGPDGFWSLVDLARHDYPAFVDRLRAADRRELIRFAWWFEEFASALLESPYVDMAGAERSEDVLEDLAQEVVGRGKAFYDAVCALPESMPTAVDPQDPAHAMRYEASAVFAERFGTTLPPWGHDY
jgi:hypothetical protein